MLFVMVSEAEVLQLVVHVVAHIVGNFLGQRVGAVRSGKVDESPDDAGCQQNEAQNHQGTEFRVLHGAYHTVLKHD